VAENPIVASGGADKRIALIDGNTGDIMQWIDAAHSGAVLSLDFHPTQPYILNRIISSYASRLLLSSSMDRSHKIFDIESGEAVQVFHDHAKYVTRVRWHSSGDMFASSSYDHTVCIYTYVITVSLCGCSA